ncbi:MAG TPA: MDR family MFS transporter [Solirubrobacteraceae bacterium]|nr:MDR family MFS transporter [Solirubrobacteraceae bacterium]
MGVAFGAIVLAMLPAVLDQTILTTALPTIATDLGRLADVSWVVTAYVAGAAVATPLWGKLGDRIGRKRMLELALAIFLTASAVCGAAPDITMLIVSRAVQGTAAGGLMTLAMAAVGDIVSPRERGRYQGYIAAAFALATVVGPLVGGLLVEHAGWRWVFYVNLPLGLLALAGLHRSLPSAEIAADPRPFDRSGAVLLAGATAGLTLACVWGGDRYGWGSPEILGLIAATLLCSGGLVVGERRAADPIVPVHLLGTRVVAVASAGLFLSTAALFAITVFVPLFLQTTTAATPTQAGLLLVPMMLGVTLSTTLSGRVTARTGRYKPFPIAGLGLMSAALVLLAIVSGDPSRTRTAIGVGVFGVGFGMVTQMLVVAVQNTVDRRELGIATATTSFFRGLGATAGAAGLGAVFATRSGLTAGETGLRGLSAAARGDLIGAVQAVFLVAAPLALLGLVIVARLPDVPLRRSPPQAGPPQAGTPPRASSPPQADRRPQAASAEPHSEAGTGRA